MMKLTPVLLSLIGSILVLSTQTNAQPVPEECHVNPDPHFRTWDGTYYDYHGGCDLILVSNSLIDLHIRTVPVSGYSFVESAILKLGADTLEVDKDGEPTVNGGAITLPHNFGGTGTIEESSLYSFSALQVLLNGSGDWIRFTSFYGSLSIDVYGVTSAFDDSVGMCGNWNISGLIDRGGLTMANGNLMGEEWRVKTGDTPLFSDTNLTETCAPAMNYFGGTGGEGGDHGAQECIIEDEGADCPCEEFNGCVTKEELNEACGDVPGDEAKRNCEFDVAITGDPDFGDAPFYHPDGIPSNIIVVDDFGGDPHIKTWSGFKYDFHGICDLVLLQNPDFQKGLGMDIHARTKQIKQFSYVSSAVLRIGDETLEVMGDNHEKVYYINKQANGDLDQGIHGYPISSRKVNSKQYEFIVDLGNEETIVFKTFKKFVRVNIQGAKRESFGSSLGLLGLFGSGRMVGRDKKSIIEDANAFGQEWQVLSSEDMLFHDVEGPQAPRKCEIPLTSTLRRRLAESNISEEEAEIACARVNDSDFDLCVFDVMATGDKDVVGAY